MQIDFEPDWDYLLEKACTFYERTPYVNIKTCYTFREYMDEHIRTFAGITKDIAQYRKDGVLGNKGHTLGLAAIKGARFEWRWEYQGPKYFPKGCKTSIEFNLRIQTGEIIDLTKAKPIRAIQPEQIWYCLYSEKTYEEVCEFWHKNWLVARTK